ncbi:hypothetical protein [Curtobacterium sp. SL109]|uniref:hypothetical protein n=1 Tax=Curtobacterium sp. SL109 TaxID=2994662 RepID=UPI0022733941|nr:hypothetical protein [Curtobacterium sp. SL109]MCY1696455.1 hypothetical protein [Curtobacterium sp. SL109]
MSDTTRQAVEEAMAAHVADEREGAYLTGFVVMAAAVVTEADDIINHQSIVPPSQALHVSVGLATLLANPDTDWLTDDGD